MKPYTKMKKVATKFHTDTLEKSTFPYEQYRSILDEINGLYDNGEITAKQVKELAIMLL